MNEQQNNQNGAANEQPVVENEKKMSLGKKIAIGVVAALAVGGGIFLAVKKPWKKNNQ